MMKTLLSFALATVALGVGCRVEARMSEPDYILANRLPETIEVEFVSPKGKSLGIKTVKAGGELSLRVSRRIVVRTAAQAREYSLPAVLLLRRKEPGAAAPYASMISGKWRVIVSSDSTLGIVFVSGGAVHEPVPDFTKPPLLFPLRPRKPSETFEQYEQDFARQERAALQR